MTLMDYTFDTPEEDPSVEVKRSSNGYRLRETELNGWMVQATRVFMAALCFGLMATGGMIWSLNDTSFPGDPAISKAVLSTAIYIVAAAFVASGAFRRKDEVIVDLKGRVVHVVSRAPLSIMKSRKTFRFEEITRIDLDETNFMTELRSALSRWDYGRITMSAHGNDRVNLCGGDMLDLEPLLRRLRADTGVA
ncbi:hypothetical protein [uncultured Litoreibacter sp.]|uniref:hypothetical protein n=1 Tax=uncultured Litoreibacter sp. TaxID=1392394 RepID=UPI0026052125|nr:hypothetical protein [uncultured Litoreibacter sp.]